MTVLTRPLFTLYINRFAALVGEYGSMITISLLIANKGATALMVLWIIQSLGPSLVLPFVGRVIDSNNKKTIMIVTDILRGLLVLCIPLFIDGWGIYVIILLVSMLRPFFTGSMQPLITSLTTDTNRQRVNSIISSISSAAYCIGPMLGGLLLIVNNSLPFIVQSAGYLLSAILLLITKYPSIKVTIDNSSESTIISRLKTAKNDIIFSFSFIKKNKSILIVLLANTIYLCGGTALDAYEVLYVTEVLGMNEATYAIAISYLGFAFIVAGILNIVVSKKLSLNVLFIGGMCLASISNILFSIATTPNIIYFSFVLLALGITSFSTAFYSINQTEIPIEYQGRVMSFQFIVPEIAIVISVLISGYFLQFMNIRPVIITLAAVSFIGFLLTLFKVRIKPSEMTQFQKEIH